MISVRPCDKAAEFKAAQQGIESEDEDDEDDDEDDDDEGDDNKWAGPNTNPPFRLT